VSAYLLDVNVLIALIDNKHSAHSIAHDWFAREGQSGFATCPLTENGAIRLISQPRYPNYVESISVAMELVGSIISRPGHVFWPDRISLLDEEQVDRARMQSPAQITDTYLLALAKSHGGTLATLDRRMVLSAVPEAGNHIRFVSAPA
jgi:uncharacterized protein